MASGGRVLSGRLIPHRRLMVYVTDVVCEPGRDAGQDRGRYFRGIRHSDAPVVIAAQLTGAAVTTESCRWPLAQPGEEVQLSDGAPARSTNLTEEAPGILINELRMGNHMNKPRRVPILVKELEGMELLRRSPRLSAQPVEATERKIINNLAEKKAAKKK